MDKRTERVGKEIRKLSHSFACAGRGIRQCVRTERNFRIHLVAAAYVSVFARMGRLDTIRCVILCLCFALVMGAELLNTAIERLSDSQERGYNGAVRDAKDIAAAAVLVCAAFCVCIAAALFLNGEVLHTIWLFLTGRVWFAALLAVSIPFAVLFVFRFARG